MDTFLCNQLSNGSNKCLWLVLGGGLVLIQYRRMHLSSKKDCLRKNSKLHLSYQDKLRNTWLGLCFVYGMWFFLRKPVAFLLCVEPVFVE